jgi:hypothetical protein
VKKFLGALAVLAAFATPASAQSFSASPYGTGNVLPFAYQPTAPRHDKILVDRSGLNAYAAVPGFARHQNSNALTATGGGSLGYNEMLKIY